MRQPKDLDEAKEISKQGGTVRYFGNEIKWDELGHYWVLKYDVEVPLDLDNLANWEVEDPIRKPCPFCGDVAELKYTPTEDITIVTCGWCGAHGPTAPIGPYKPGTSEAAAWAWNMRKEEPC